MVSVFLTPIYIVSNMVQYLLCLGMRTVPLRTFAVDSAAPPNSMTHKDTPRADSVARGQIIECPHCKIRVCVTADGACPSCRKSI